ncbi:MAG: D-tyrosyl-tRNA(Tyr) deacylase [Polyangiaceae bacterium]|nr:D-tyrosyl-tRNA(Tyr) deacylase [Polyangiaceae bacterium]
MKAVVQRVTSARVEVADETVGAIDRGLVAFVGAQAGDAETDLDYIARKLPDLRVFEDERGKMARSVVDAGGGLLVVSQFTLLGDVSKGNRPSFSGAMAPAEAEAFLVRLVERLRTKVSRVETGRFGAEMRVLVDNDGPVTILLDSRAR